MPFVTPALFWAGLAAAAGPVIIHLLNRRRFRILDWAAMEFLLQSQRKNRRRLRLEELILLFLRVLGILLMGCALARPLLARPTGTLLGRSSADVVIILDDSYSMAQKQGAGTVFSRATEGLAQLVSQLDKRDKVTILLTSRPEPLFATANLTDPDALKQELKQLTPSHYATDLVGGIQKALEVFKESKNPDKRLYLLSDFRRREWNLDAGGSQGQKLASQLALLDRKRFHATLVDFGVEDYANITVQELVCADKHAVRNVRLRFRVTVVNNGPQPVNNVPVTLQVGDIKLPAVVLERLDPGQPRTAEFSYRFKEAGAAAVTATIPGDQLAVDNARYLAVNVVDAVPVLLVNGNPDNQPFINEVDYFAVALDPGKKNLSGYRPEAVLDRDLPNQKLSTFDCVVLGNVGSLLPDSVRALEDYVRKGGGLVIFLGDKIDRNFYNTQLYREGNGLLPLPIDQPRGDLEQRSKFAKLKREAVHHPVMAVFTGAGEQLLDLVPFYRYYPLRAERVGAVTVLASLIEPGAPNPIPAIVEKTFREGRVIQIASSMNAAWNDWPKSISYPIVVNEMVNYLSRRPHYENTQLVGTALRREVEPEFYDALITLRTPQFPEQDAIKIAPKLEGERMFVTWPPPLAGAETGPGLGQHAERRLEGLDRAGIYTLELNAGNRSRCDYFARNVDPDEGRLEKAEAALVKQIMKDVPFDYRQSLAVAEAREASAGRELWRLVMFVLLGVLVVETILAQRFGHYST